MKVVSLQDLVLTEMIEALQQGKTIVYPTETCYGLGCDATNQSAVDEIYRIKQRQKDKPLLMVVSSIGMAMEYVQWNATIEKLAEQFWPGPLTIVSFAKSQSQLAKGIIGHKDMVAFRVTSHPLATALSAQLHKPIVSTSANLSSLDDPYDIADVIDMFTGKEHRPDIVIDAGALPHNSPSTIVRVVGEKIEVIRQGGIVIPTIP